MAVPFLASRTGIIPALIIIAIAYVGSVLLHMMIAEMSSGSGGKQLLDIMTEHLFKGRFEKPLTWVFFILILFGFIASLGAYIAGAGEILSELTGLNKLACQLIFFLAAAGIVVFGLKVLGISEKIAILLIAAVFAVLIVASLLTGLHSIPRAIEHILSAYEEILTGEEENTHRHRIDHFEFPRKDQIKRITDLGLLITAQPGYSWMDERFQKAYHQYLTKEQYESQIPLKTIVDAGGIICGSSDSPVQDINPFLQIQGMVDFPLKDQRLSTYEAIKTYTVNGAYSTFEENQRGQLTPGMAADFIIMDRDPFKTSPEQLTRISVQETWIDGKKIEKKMYSTFGFLFRALLRKRVLI